MRAVAKKLFYRAVRYSGLNAILLRTPWRANRLLILCYHGISLDDEHLWSQLYMPPNIFQSRLECLEKWGCSVLPLGPALERLRDGRLPPRAVVITFDDGFYDFYSKAWPLLRQFGFPATVYLTTYYSWHNWPVFDPMCEYLIWKGQGKELHWPEMGIGPVRLNDTTAAATAAELKDACLRWKLDGREKNLVLRELGERLGLDLDDLCSRRLLHLMTPAEANQVSAEGASLQLHCHRHRVYRSKPRFLKELADNRERIQQMGVPEPRHFCYPGGYRLTEFPGWLEEFGILSATTCEYGLAARESRPYEIPRVLDVTGISTDEFAAWVSGIASYVPRPPVEPPKNQLIEEPPGGEDLCRSGKTETRHDPVQSSLGG